MRGKSKALMMYHLNGKGKVWVMKTESLCAISALISAVDVSVGYKAARILHVEWRKMKAKIRPLADLKHLIKGVK